MKITTQHVGKRFINGRHIVTILFVGQQRIFVRDQNGNETGWDNEDTDWQLVEEPKKPSERINDLLGAKGWLPIHEWDSAPKNIQDALLAILTHLDEQAEKAPR